MTNVHITPADHDGLRAIMICKSDYDYVAIISDEFDTAYLRLSKNQLYNLRSQINLWLNRDDDE